MPEVLLSIYNSLDYESQNAVRDFMFFMAFQQKKKSDNRAISSDDLERKKKASQYLQQFRGRLKLSADYKDEIIAWRDEKYGRVD